MRSRHWLNLHRLSALGALAVTVSALGVAPMGCASDSDRTSPSGAGGDATKDAGTSDVPDSDVSSPAPADGGTGCEQDCFGGACVQGICQPVAIYTTELEGGRFAALAAGGGRIYWADYELFSRASRIGSAGLDGSDVARVSGPSGSVTGLAVTAASLFWSEAANNAGPPSDYWLKSAPLSGGLPVTLVTTKTGLGDVVISGPNIYWIGDDANGPEYALFKAALGAKPPLAPAPVFDGAVFPGEIDFALASESIAYLSKWSVDGKIARVDLHSGEVTNVVSDAYPAKVEVDASHLYWVSEYGTFGNRRLKWANLDGSNVRDFTIIDANGEERPVQSVDSLLVTDDAIYYGQDDTLYRSAKRKKSPLLGRSVGTPERPGRA